MRPRARAAPPELELVRVLKALADTTRLGIVQSIAAAGEMTCGDVVDRFDLSQPTISHHLKILADAGIVTCRQEGKHHFLSVDQALVERIGVAIAARVAPPRKKRA